MTIANNIHDTALIFEGGGMRASYTAGILNNLLENEIYFDYVAGISAGSSHSVNYLSRDIERAKRSFVDLVMDPQFGGWRSFFTGEGYFRAQYIYEETHIPTNRCPLTSKHLWRIRRNSASVHLRGIAVKLCIIQRRTSMTLRT